jgi:hypothetical protein
MFREAAQGIFPPLQIKAKFKIHPAGVFTPVPDRLRSITAAAFRL